MDETSIPTVLLLLLLASLLDAEKLDASCAPATCGNLTIKYPFWLRSKQPSYCGYPAFEITCDFTGATPPILSGSFINVLDIQYGNSSMVASNTNLVLNGNCRPTLVNISNSLALTQLTVSRANWELFFFGNCSQSRLQRAPEGSHQLNCSGLTWFVYLGQSYDTGVVQQMLSMGCSFTVVPVLPGSELKTMSDYGRLVRSGFILEWTEQGDCAACNASGGQCRYDAGVKGFRCLCPDGGLQPATCDAKTSNMKMILIVLISATAALLFPCLCVLIRHKRWQKPRLLPCVKATSKTQRNIEDLLTNHGSLAPTRYKYSDLKKITSCRSDKLGNGGYGMVFKGKLRDGRLVAVKFLHDSKGNGEEFVNEVISIGRTSHVNIVTLFGFCLDGLKRALVYEYMHNGSLDKYIYSENAKANLGWQNLYMIAIGIARGLEYLHQGCNTRIIHFDIKPQNILLDQEFHPKIADFGLAKLCHAKESKLSMAGARGTAGFIAPEVFSRSFGVVSTKSDVYSYGMMLLEMVGVRKNMKEMVDKSSEEYFPDWIYDHFHQNDGSIACKVTSEVEEITKKITLIGLWCVQVMPMHRPTISKVLEMFERSTDGLGLPPKQNFYALREDPPQNLNAESASSTNTSQAQILSEVLRVEEISLVNSEALQ